MDILERLRAVQNDSAQYAAGSDIMRDAADEITRLRAELEAANGEAEALRVDAERLQVEMTNIVCSIPEGYYMDPPDGGDTTVAEQVRRMAADVERYRFLRDKKLGATSGITCTGVRYNHLYDSKLDAAIDAARGGK